MRKAVLGFSYGYRKDNPGVSNLELIRKFYERSLENGILPAFDLILQQALADAHSQQGLAEYDEFYGSKIVHIICEHRISGEYLDTAEVARQGIEFAAIQGYKDLVVLAYPYIHRPYCVWSTRRLAKPQGIAVKAARVGWIHADPLSEQWWTRNFIWPIFYILKRVFLLKVISGT